MAYEHSIDKDRCKGCGLCPDVAITISEIEAEAAGGK